MAIQKQSYANSIYNERSAEINVVNNFKQEYGAVYTRPEVVDFILDLAGYTSDKPLHRMRILEPSFGQGDFLVKIIKRLLCAWKTLCSSDSTPAELSEAILAVELNVDSFLKTYECIVSLLIEEEFSSSEAVLLANSWLLRGDFLISDINEKFDFIVGNPPYIRQEAVAQMAEYRSRYKTVCDRADIYIPFIERSLSLLAAGGRLSFICADRWMKNRYGKALRGYIDANYRLKIYVDMVGTPAFYSDVSAYPAIVVIGNDQPGPTRIAQRPLIERHYLNSLAQTLTRDDSFSKKSNTVFEIEHVTNGTEPWLLCVPDQVQLLRKLEEKFPLLEDVGCRVGIGVATGADKAFIGDYDSLDVEDTRKVPLVTTKDILAGEVRWAGKGVINPFEDDGRLVSLSTYPKLQSYLESKRTIIAARHCAQKNPTNWYRTIDRIVPVLTSTPKLLIPDIKGEPHIVYEEGRLYPHHNLYYIISESWDLRALQAVLLSSLAKLFIMNYSIKMRGDYLRFQAQYLRRICIPSWDSVPNSLRKKLISAATSRDISACNQAVYGLFGLNEEEQKIVKEAVSNGT